MQDTQQGTTKVIKKKMTSLSKPQSEYKRTLSKVFCTHCTISNTNNKQTIQCKCNTGLIYVGGSGTLTSQILSKHNIAAVLTVIDYKRYHKEHIDQKVEDIDEIQQHQYIDISDDHPDILPYLTHSYHYISEVLSRNLNLLIHSNDGLSRSPTVAIHYIMQKYQIDFEKAYQIIKSKKPQINITPSLIQQLNFLKN